MSRIDRRHFLQHTFLTGAGLVLAPSAFSAILNSNSSIPAIPKTTGATGRVVVIGGGMAGATVAKYLRLWGGEPVQVTLIERNPVYTSNILSNLVLTGQQTIANLQVNYSLLSRNYGIKLIQAVVNGIDPVSRQVMLDNGTRIPYDRLVIAPGVEFDITPGLESTANQALFPHAWSAGSQTSTLRNQLLAMPAGGTFIMSIPAAPYRCPPGPYERACVVADWFKRYKPNSKVIVLDANPGIMAEAGTFTNAFNNIHRGVIQYVPNAAVLSVDPASRTVKTSAGTFKGNVINPIPPHRAGKIIQTAGLATVSGRWATVDVLSYESRIAAGIHVIGDAAGTTQPKAGHIANAEAKVCADAICQLLRGQQPNQNPVTNSACYSPITASTASWLTAIYGYDPVNRVMKVTASGEAATINRENYDQMNKWFKGLMNDTFA